MLCEGLTHAALPVRVRVVDDGSGEAQQAWLAEYVSSLQPKYAILDDAQMNATNLGKGGAVYSGWDFANGADCLGFVDADGAVAPFEVVRLCQLSLREPMKAIFAVRTGTERTTVKRDFRRRIAGQIFRRLVRLLFRFPLPDTQCGCKIVPSSAMTIVRPLLSEMRFTFDVELTWHLLHQKIEIKPVPIDWVESPGSRLRPASVLAMIQSLRVLSARLGQF